MFNDAFDGILYMAGCATVFVMLLLATIVGLVVYVCVR